MNILSPKCTINKFQGYTGGVWRDDTSYVYFTSRSSTDELRGTLITFTTPDFIGVPTHIKLILGTNSRDVPENVGGAYTLTFGYNLCTSNANMADYINKRSVADEYAIASGKFGVNWQGAPFRCDIPLKGVDIKPNTTYYLYLLPYTSLSSSDWYAKINFRRDTYTYMHIEYVERPSKVGLITSECTKGNHLCYYGQPDYLSWLSAGWAQDFGSQRAGTTYWTFVLMFEFTTPASLGADKTISFYMTVGSTDRLNDGADEYRYAIASSSEYKDLYINTRAAVTTDPTQLQSGIVTQFRYIQYNVSHKALLTLDASKLEGNKTYYLYLWSYDGYGTSDTRASATMNSITIDHIGGVLHLDEGDKIEAYDCYIDNGTGWDKCIAYVDDGNQFNLGLLDQLDE